MTEHGSPNIIIIDGASLDEMQHKRGITIDLKKLTTFLEKNLKDYELYYFNNSLCGKPFLHVVENLGYKINIEAKTQANIGHEIANQLANLGKYSNNILIVGGLLPQYAEVAQKIAKDISKTINTVTIYSFVDLIIQKAFIGNNLLFCDLGSYEKELGITHKKSSELKIDPVNIVQSTGNLLPKPPVTPDQKTLILVDGHTLGQVAGELKETIDFKKLKNLITKGLGSYDLRYFNLNSTDKILVDKLVNLGYTVDTSSIKKTKIECAISSTLAKTISQVDSIIIIGEANHNYLPPLINMNTDLAKKPTQLFAVRKFACKDQTKNSIIFHNLKDLINEVKVTQDAVIFIDAENLNNMIAKMGIEPDWENLLKLLLNGRNLVGAFYYMRMPLTEEKAILGKKLKSLGYTVIHGPANCHDTDPLMIRDIQQIAQTDAANNFIVVSGDNSYADPLADACVERDWRCEVFSTNERLSYKYKSLPGLVVIEAEKFIDIISIKQTKSTTTDPEKSDEKEENMDKIESPVTEPISDAENLLAIINKMIVKGTLINADITVVQDNREINIKIGTKEKPQNQT